MKSDNYNGRVIYVILRNKIVGIDSVLSSCMNIHGKCGYVFNFICLDSATYKNIIEDNIVLRDAISSIGKIELIASDKYKSNYISKLFIIYYFAKVIFNITVRNSYVIHFAHLNSKPFVWFRWLFKKNNVIFMERTYFSAEIDKGLLDSKKHDSKLKLIYDTRSTYDEISEYGIDIYSHPPLLYAGILIGYDEEWNYFKHPEAKELKKIVFKNSRKNKYWVDFINKHAKKYIEDQMPKGCFESNKILVFIATRIMRSSDPNLINEFVGALKALSKYTHIFPLFIKLHTYSDIEFVNELLSISLGSVSDVKYVITTLHPEVLATRSVISVFANEGTIMEEFSVLWVPVVDLQIYENILPPFCLESSINLSEGDLTRRYNEREKFSDYTFTDAKDFDKFMEGIVDTSYSLDDTKIFISDSKKNMSNLWSCDFSTE